MNIHVVKHLSSTPKAELEKMLRNALGKELILELREGAVLTLKGDLELSWFCLSKLGSLVINCCNQPQNNSTYKFLTGCLCLNYIFSLYFDGSNNGTFVGIARRNNLSTKGALLEKTWQANLFTWSTTRSKGTKL